MDWLLGAKHGRRQDAVWCGGYDSVRIEDPCVGRSHPQSCVKGYSPHGLSPDAGCRRADPYTPDHQCLLTHVHTFYPNVLQRVPI